jgi:hypothetical protein
MRTVKAERAKVKIFLEDGTHEDVDATVVGSLAVMQDYSLTHVATGLKVAGSGGESLARHLLKEVRWTWLDQQPFGIKPQGRGATMAKKSLEAALASFGQSA